MNIVAPKYNIDLIEIYSFSSTCNLMEQVINLFRKKRKEAKTIAETLKIKNQQYV